VPRDAEWRGTPDGFSTKDVPPRLYRYMGHHESEGGDQWHCTGPWFLVAR
jgi:hypothetical protein